MRALRRIDARVGIDERPALIPSAGQASIRVAYAGLCRTDVYVAQGLLSAANPITLGHEFSGTIAALGEGVKRLRIGQRVAVMPILPCSACPQCLGDDPLVCQRTQMLGVDLDGGFADDVLVPAQAIYPIPDQLSLKVAAYLEPIAASMAALAAPIHPSQRGVIYGDNRIATLTERVLRASGFEELTVWTQAPQALPKDAYDFAIETVANAQVMSALISAVRPRGVLVLKSRPVAPVALDWRALLAKELTLRATQYAPFERAIELAMSERLHIEDLLGPAHPLEDYELLLSQEQHQSKHKVFFCLDPQAK